MSKNGSFVTSEYSSSGGLGSDSAQKSHGKYSFQQQKTVRNTGVNQLQYNSLTSRNEIRRRSSKTDDRSEHYKIIRNIGGEH